MADAVKAKVWYKSKTVWASIIVPLIWVLSVVSGYIRNPLYLGGLTAASVVLGIVLRWLTGQPITLKDLEAVAKVAAQLKAVDAENEAVAKELNGKNGG